LNIQGLVWGGFISKVPAEDRTMSLKQKFIRVKQSNAAILSTEDSIVQQLINLGWTADVICSVFSTVEVASEPIKMAMLVKRGSPLKQFFNFA